MGQAVNEIISRSKVTVEKINDSWTVRSMTSVWSAECARLYGGMRERAAEGKGSVASDNRIYRYGKQILFIPMHLEMNQCMLGWRQRGQSG